MSDILFDLIELVAEVVVDLIAEGSRKHRTYTTTKPYDSIEDRYHRMNNDPDAFTRGLEEPDTLVEESVPNQYVNTTREETIDEMIEVEQEQNVVESKEVIQEDNIPQPSVSITAPAELEIMMLVYMFQQDDDKITRDEAKIIKKYVKTNAVSFGEKQLNRIKSYSNKTLSYSDVQAFITENEISTFDVQKAFKELQKVNKVTKRHDQIIRFLQNAILFD